MPFVNIMHYAYSQAIYYRLQIDSPVSRDCLVMLERGPTPTVFLYT